jgi:hypothetical protein
MKHSAQSGFAVVLIIAIIAVLGTGASLAYMRVKSLQNDKLAADIQNMADGQIAQAQQQAENKKKESVTKATEAAEAAAKAAAATPTTVATQVSTVARQVVTTPKPFTDDNCKYTTITAYAANKNGTPLSTKNPGEWTTTKTVAYGEPITGL